MPPVDHVSSQHEYDSDGGGSDEDSKNGSVTGAVTRSLSGAAVAKGKRPLRPTTDPVLRAIDVVVAVVHVLQFPSLIGGAHGQFYSPTSNSAIQSLEQSLGLFSAMEMELVAYGRTYDLPPLYALRGRFATFYGIMRASPFLRERLDKRFLMTLWDGALGRTRAGRRAFFDFLSRSSGGNRLEPRKVANDYNTLQKVGQALFPPDNGGGSAAHVEYRLSYRMNLRNERTRNEDNTGFLDLDTTVIPRDTMRDVMAEVFRPGSDVFNPTLLGPDGLRCVLTLFITMNSLEFNPHSEVFPKFDGNRTYFDQKLFLVGPDRLSDPVVLKERYRGQGNYGSAGDSSTDAPDLAKKAQKSLEDARNRAPPGSVLVMMECKSERRAELLSVLLDQL